MPKNQKTEAKASLSVEQIKDLCIFMKAQGADMFKVGDVIIQFKPVVSFPTEFVNPNPPDNETPEAKAEREKREYEEVLFHSANAGG